MEKWDKDLYLFTPEELARIPDGTILTSINNINYIKGKDYIDDDTRFGYTAYGVKDPWNDTRFGYTAYGVKDPWNHPLKDLFLIFKLTE